MGNRADNHDGSCREILTGKHAGKWRVQFTQIGTTGLKVRLSRLFRTKTEAKDFLRQLRKGKVVQEEKLTREPTLGEWFEWLAVNDWPETLATVTIAQRRSRFKRYSNKHFGHKRLSTIDPLNVRAFYKKLREDGVSDSLILTIKSDLVRAFNQAITPYQRIPMTVANPFRLSLAQPKARDAVALNPSEVKKAIDSKSLTLSQSAMLGLFLLAGLRLGEVMAISKRQLRFESNLIVVDRAVHVEFGGKQWVGLPKGGKTRNAVMCPTLRKILVEYTADFADDDLLWSSATENKPRMKKRIYAFWKKIVSAAKLPPTMSPHDCRLTHINLVEKLMLNVSSTTLKEHVGHAATGVTEAHYTRPISSSQNVLMKEIERLLGKKPR